MVFLKFISGIYKTLNDRWQTWYDDENNGNFPKISTGFFAERNWMKHFAINLHRNNSDNFFATYFIIVDKIGNIWKYFGSILFANISK